MSIYTDICVSYGFYLGQFRSCQERPSACHGGTDKKSFGEAAFDADPKKVHRIVSRVCCRWLRILGTTERFSATRMVGAIRVYVTET